jgi:exodeoxyribonuclease-3
MAWNIEQGGSDRRPRILDQIADSNALVVGLTEIRANNVDAWIDGLKRRGYIYVEHSCPDGKDEDQVHSALIASKVPLQRVQLEPVEDPERWVAAYIPSLDVEVLCVHIPGEPDDKKRPGLPTLAGIDRKNIMWQAVDRYIQPRKDRRVILLGDFNTGYNDIDKDPGGKAFKCVEFLDRLAEAGFVDVWRAVHPTRRESTWKSSRNGFRLDHVFVSEALGIGIVDAKHVHRVRGLVGKGGLSDHSIVIVDLDLTVMVLELIA